MLHHENTALYRIDWIDFAKGITILLVIIGHTVSEGFYGGLLRGLIFSFHMPLFFIVSCTTYRCSETMEEYQKKLVRSARYLLTPVVLTFGLDTIFQCFRAQSLFSNGNMRFWIDKLFTFVFASGVSTSYNGFDVALMGIPWFFFALFVGRSIFDFIHLSCSDDTKTFLYCCIVGMIGILYGKIQWMPFSMDIALAILPFFYHGYRMKYMNLNEYPLRKMLIWILVWLITLALTFTGNWTYMELAVRRYPLFPICYIAAIAGTMAVCECSIIFCRLKRIVAPLIFIGKNSMYLLCIHIMDGYWSELWFVQNHQFDSALRRLFIDMAIFLLIMQGKRLCLFLNAQFHSIEKRR